MLKLSPKLKVRIKRMNEGIAGVPDCVPVSAQICHHSAKLAGESTYDFFTDAETFLRSQIYADEFYSFDGLTIHYDTYNIEAEVMGVDLIWNENQIPEVDPTKHFLASPDDIKNIKPIKFGKTGRMPYVLEINDRLIDLGVTPKFRFCGVVSLAAKLLGFENLVMTMVTNPQSIHRLLTFLADEIIAPWIVCQRQRYKYNVTATCSEAIASPPLLTVPLIREFCLKYIERLEKTVGNIRLSGLFGERLLDNPEELLDIKKQGCPSSIQALDPDATELGPAFFKKYADKHNMAIIMGIDTNIIQDGPVGEIKNRIRTFIHQAGRDGRFCVYINYIPYDAKPKHIHAVVSTAHEYRYNS